MRCYLFVEFHLAQLRTPPIIAEKNSIINILIGCESILRKVLPFIAIFVFAVGAEAQTTVTPTPGSDITSNIINNDNIVLTGGTYTIDIPAPGAITTHTETYGGGSNALNTEPTGVVPGVSPNSINNPGGYGLFQGPFLNIILPPSAETGANPIDTGLNYNQAAYNGSFPTSSIGFFQPGQVLITYSGQISGTGQIKVTNSLYNSANPGLNGQVTGGVLNIISAQTFTNPNGPIFIIDPNTILALGRNGQQGEHLTTIGTIINGQSIVNNGFFFAADQGTGTKDNFGRLISDPTPANSNFLQISGVGITAFGDDAFAVGGVGNGTGTQSIGGPGTVLGPLPSQGGYSGPITDISLAKAVLDLEQGDINGGSIVNEDVYSPGDTNRIDGGTGVNLLEPNAGGNGSSVSIAQLNAGYIHVVNGSYDSLEPGSPNSYNPTIVNGNVYSDAANTLPNGGEALWSLPQAVSF